MLHEQRPDLLFLRLFSVILEGPKLQIFQCRSLPSQDAHLVYLDPYCNRSNKLSLLPDMKVILVGLLCV